MRFEGKGLMSCCGEADRGLRGSREIRLIVLEISVL